MDCYSFCAELCPSKIHMLRPYSLPVWLHCETEPVGRAIKVKWNPRGGVLTLWVNCLSRKRKSSRNLSLLVSTEKKMPDMSTGRKCLLQIKDTGFTKQLPWCHLLLGLLDSRTLRIYISIVEVTQCVAFCSGSPSILIHECFNLSLNISHHTRKLDAILKLK